MNFVLPAHAGMIRPAVGDGPFEYIVLPAHAGMIQACRTGDDLRAGCSPLTRG